MSRKHKNRRASFVEQRRNLPAEARTLIANAANDITIPFFSGVLQHADDTLIQQGGGKGLAIYDEIERDSHAFAMLQKRKKMLLARSKAKAGAAEAMDKALRAIVSAAAKFEDDAIARDYIVSFEITDQLSDKTIDALVAARQAFAGGADPAQPEEAMIGDPAMFSAERLKKKR